MKARLLVVVLCVPLVVLGPLSASAASQSAAGRATLTSHAGVITGMVRDGNDQPIPAARLRLRDLTSGRILMVTRGDQQGMFRFTGVPPGSYLVELVDESGRVKAVSPTLALRAGGTVSTLIRSSSDARWYSGFFSNSAMAVISSAAGLGVTAVGNGFQPASGRF